jgi:hypothetical protein
MGEAAMRQALVVVLMLILGVPSALAESPAAAKPGLFSRWFKPSSGAPRVEKEEPKTISLTAAELVKGTRQTQALADWMRRSEVCLKLRDIAHETGDDDLWRKTDQLEQRAYDAYIQQTGRAVASIDDATLQQRLPRDDNAMSRLLRPFAAGRRDAASAGQAKLTEGR